MGNYFYSNGQQSFGPFGLDELRAMNVVRPTTKVWREGMADWVDASTMDEMNDWFSTATSSTPPPVKVVVQSDDNQTIEIHTTKNAGQTVNGLQLPSCPFSWLAPSIIATVLCCMPFGVVGIVYAAKVEGRYNRGDYQGAKEASSAAQMWTWISVGVGLLGVVSWISMVALGMIAGV